MGTSMIEEEFQWPIINNRGLPAHTTFEFTPCTCFLVANTGTSPSIPQ